MIGILRNKENEFLVFYLVLLVFLLMFILVINQYFKSIEYKIFRRKFKYELGIFLQKPKFFVSLVQQTYVKQNLISWIYMKKILLKVRSFRLF